MEQKVIFQQQKKNDLEFIVDKIEDKVGSGSGDEGFLSLFSNPFIIREYYDSETGEIIYKRDEMKHTDINPDIYIYIESLSSFGSKTFYILNRSGSDSYSFTGIAPNSIPSVSLIVFEPIPNSNDMYTKHAYMADLTFEEDD